MNKWGLIQIETPTVLNLRCKHRNSAQTRVGFTRPGKKKKKKKHRGVNQINCFFFIAGRQMCVAFRIEHTLHSQFVTRRESNSGARVSNKRTLIVSVCTGCWCFYFFFRFYLLLQRKNLRANQILNFACDKIAKTSVY